jgi:1-acyl-sn-glycerol-3-phosphate acyltransferase
MKLDLSGNTYTTPFDMKRSFINRLLFGWRWAFYLQFIGDVLQARKISLKEKYTNEEWVKSSQSVLHHTEQNGGRFEISGFDILRSSNGPFVFVCNHMSSLETQVFAGIILPFMPLAFVVKNSLITNPVFGPVMRATNPISVNRKNAREDLEAVLQGGTERLNAGISIMIFPQSTRNPVFKRNQFNSLGVKLAARAGVPVLPMAIKSDFWGEQGLFRGFGPIDPRKTIHIEFGAPLHIEGRGKKEQEEIVSFVESRLLQWGALIED